MAREHRGALSRDLGAAFGRGILPAGDRDLLGRFVARRDEAAFEALVVRHGPLVQGVCRRLLDDPNDVDDAFQATFLVLVLKASRVRDADRLGPWLHGVATRVARKARSRRGRHLALRVGLVDPRMPEELADVRPILDAELGRLAPKQREVLVLCLLEGATAEEAARRLDCPLGTVKSRLARGRQALQSRLVARGVAPAAALAASTAFAPPVAVAAASVRAAVAGATAAKFAPALLTLARGVAPAMIPRPIALAALILGGISLAGLGTVEYLGARAQAPPAPANPQAAPKVTVAVVRPRAVTVTWSYVCRLNAHRHIEVRAPEAGFLDEVAVREGQTVRGGDLLCRIKPVLGRARPDAQVGDEPTAIRAAFGGRIGGLIRQEGSLVREGEAVTTLDDAGVIWAYFNVPEARYLEIMTEEEGQPEPRVELRLANGSLFPEEGKIDAIEARFNPEDGTIPFRADFPNPKGLLRHGQAATLLLSRVIPDAIAIPPRSTYEVAGKRFVHVVDGAGVARSREVTIRHEVDDLFVVKPGLAAGERIVDEGTGLVRDGDPVGRQVPEG